MKLLNDKTLVIAGALALGCAPALAETGIASWYDYPQRVACGGSYHAGAMTAAHRHLACGSRVVVTDLATGRAITVTINDRGPFVGGRIIDLSRAAAEALSITRSGLARVRVEPAP